MAEDIPAAVREICLSFPEAEEYVSHGAPNFRIRGKKTFAIYVVNHHGDGRLALWLNSPTGAQDQHTRNEPQQFFVPPYVGPRGWLGVQLDQGLSWKRIAALVREAYENTAPPKLSAQIGTTIEIKPPSTKLAAGEFDPMQTPAAQRLLKQLDKICLAWPETTQSRQFGSPVWKAGNKTFACAYFIDRQFTIAIWVGVDQQGFYTPDSRYSIHAYMGHNGWIALAVGSKPDWEEIESLAKNSYRHFALKRMLAKLDVA